MFMVPTMFVRLLKLPEEVRRRYDLSSLRFVMHAAAPCPADVKRAMIEWWGPVINEFYGATEIGAVTLVSTATTGWRKPGTVGRAGRGRDDLRILDDDGPRAAAGRGRRDLHAHRATTPTSPTTTCPTKRAEIERDGLITVGDIGYLDADGYLFLCDRKRDMVISGGVNIYPAEIEAVLHRACPACKDCAVFGIPDDEFGEALMRRRRADARRTRSTPTACAPTCASTSPATRCRAASRSRRDLPREDSGKIFKRRLREPYWKDAGRKI